MSRPPRFVNQNKLVLTAHKTKSKVKLNKIAAYQKWHKKLGGKVKRLDKVDAQLRKTLKELQAIKAQEDLDHKMRQRFARIIEGAMKEIKMFKEIPVGQPMPVVPTKVIAVQGFIAVVIPILAYIGYLKIKMAMAEAQSDKKK